jgi:hypothetical protein
MSGHRFALLPARSGPAAALAQGTNVPISSVPQPQPPQPALWPTPPQIGLRPGGLRLGGDECELLATSADGMCVPQLPDFKSCIRSLPARAGL